MRLTEFGSSSAPAVVLLHGVPSDSADFAPVVEALAPHRRVIAVDFPGYKGIPPLTGPDTFAQTEEALIDALAEHGVREAAVVGYSGGAFRAVSLSFSARFRVSRLVIVSGYAGLDQPAKDGFAGLAAALHAGVDLSGALPERMVSPGFLARNPNAADRVKGWLSITTGAALADEILSFVTPPDYRPRLREWTIPVLAISGSLDQAVPTSWSHEMKQWNPAVEVVVLDDVGHAVFLEAPAEMVRLVARGCGVAA